jgi:tetratricopeptide (TPR) repeat protein/HEAT repeat protein
MCTRAGGQSSWSSGLPPPGGMARLEPKTYCRGVVRGKPSGARATRALRALLALSLLGVLADAHPASAQDFNPEGRRRRPAPRDVPRSAPPAKPRPKATPRAVPGAAPQSAAKPDGDSKVLIDRYLAILDKDPGADFPLERLAQLYRQRDGNLDALAQRFEARAAQPNAEGRRASLTLAGVYVQAGDKPRAEALYEKVLRESPGDELAARKLSQLLAERGDKAGAVARLEPTLGAHLPDVVREQTLRSLLAWSLDLSDLDGARKYHAALVKMSQQSFFVQAELGRLLMERRMFGPAEAEYRRLVEASRGDSRTLGPALRDLGQALRALGKYDEALKVLNEAARHVGKQSGLRLEILKLLVEAYRDAERLPELVTRLEKEGASDTDQLMLLGALYEETGQVDRARKTYETALAKSPNSIEVRLKVVQLLELSGELEKVIEHYQKLTQIAPQNPDFAFRLAEARLARGERNEALRVLTDLEARARGDEEALTALVDFYERVGESERALQLLTRLAQGDSARHLVELGDRYFARGENERAMKIWQRIAKDPNDAEALHTLGEVYLDHDMPDQAIATLGQAMRLAPGRVAFAKSYGLALERAGAGAANASTRSRHYREAQQLWEQLLARAGTDNDGNLARESRQHIVTLWSLTGTLAERVAPLARRFEATPPDLEAGRLLAETELRLRRLEAAEKTLRAIIEHAPGDTESYLRLERALVQRGELEGAILVLAKLATLDPGRAKEYFQRMASYAAESYQDDRAIEYAARAVELGPDDAEGHQRLGEMYRERQDVEHAILEFRQALRKNDRLFTVHFQLAELLLNRQDVDEADQLLRQVMRSSPDEQLIARAARLSMQIHLGRGTLESLEKELLPIALAHPGRPIYRRLLVEIYGALAFPLESKAKSQDREGALARAALARLGQRAVKPLLDALGDPRDTQQRIAIELLSYIQNKSAGPTLLTFASGNAEPDLRLGATLAAGALGDPALYRKFEDLVFKDGASDADPVSVAAVWALANLRADAARPALERVLRERGPNAQALAAIGLGRLGSARDIKRLTSIVGSNEHALITRAAAAFGLSELPIARAAPGILALADASDVVVRATATVSLARLDAPGARPAIAQALVSPDAELVAAGVQAACVLGAGSRTEPPRSQSLPLPEGRVDARAILQRMLPNDCTPDAEARALVLLAPDIASAAARSVRSSPAQARSLAATLLANDGSPAFAPLSEHLAGAGAENAAAAKESVELIAKAVVEPYLELAEHPATEVRSSAVRWLASRPEPRAQKAVLAAVNDSDLSVQRGALSTLESRPDPAAARAISGLLSSSKSWSIRRQAAQTLERMGGVARSDEVLGALEQAALADGYALVRDAAVRALHAVDARGTKSVLERVARTDPEAGVQATVRQLLERSP